ncbi:MAG: twin-arginine translocase subunit TatC [Candidatus Nomurabacteria bacterium]|nr:twin-arginine translocase subunit TatC [Candidatus Nomurabacteria bacterium]
MNNFQKSINKYAVYFEELRKKFVLLVKIFAVVFVLGFFNIAPIVKLLLKYLTMEGVTIVTTSPFQLVDLAMSIGFFMACVVTIPIFIYFLYSFLKPALLPKEIKFFLLSLPLGLGLFIVGFLYSAVMLYYAIKLIAIVNVSLGVVNYWDISAYVYQVILTSTLLGVLFIFPLVITFLIRLGILSVQFLRSKRRHAIVIIFIIVSLLPPTDGLSLVLMATPLVLIYELTVLFNRKNGRGRHLEI